MSEIVRYAPPNVDDTLRLGDVLAKSGFFTDARQSAQAVVKILAGREMGFGEIASMTGIHVIQGRVTVGANLMAAAVKKSGKYDYRVRQMTPDVCEIEFLQREGSKWESLGVSTFTIADARKAQTKNLDKYARNMLFARAMSNGVRWYCPDALGGAPVYTPDEMGAETDEEGNMVQSAAVVVETPAPELPAADVEIEELHDAILFLYRQHYPKAKSKSDNEVLEMLYNSAGEREDSPRAARMVLEKLQNAVNKNGQAAPA